MCFNSSKDLKITLLVYCDFFCILGDNLLTTIKVTATQSNTYMYNACIAPNAVDNKILQAPTSNDTELCQSCSVTNGTVPAWLQLDLGNKYLSGGVRVYGRDNGKFLLNVFWF